MKNDKGFMTGYKYDIILAMLLFPRGMTPRLKGLGRGCSENLESSLGVNLNPFFFSKVGCIELSSGFKN